MTSFRRNLPAPFQIVPSPARATGSSLSAIARTTGQSGGQERYAATLQAARQDAPEPTPTANAQLPFRRGGFSSLCVALDYAAQGATGLNFYDARGNLRQVLSWNTLRGEALAFARRLIGAGIGRGERVLLIADTSPAFCIAFFGAQYAGIVPVPVSTPVGLGSRTHYIDQVRRQIAGCDAVAILGPDEFVSFACEAAHGTTAHIARSFGDIHTLPPSAAALQPLIAGEACYVQFSSGSTRAPRGIDIRQNQLMANIDASLAAQQICETDSGVSWLPLYHDMGLIGFVLAPLCAQRTVDLMSPQDFAKRPMQWLSMISRRRASITHSPSFGYDLVVRRAKTQMAGELDLSGLRLAGIGADMIQPAVLERFADSFAAHGFDRRAFMASYGMAEVCVGLSFGAPLGGLKIDSFRDSQTGKSRDFVICGRVIDGHRVEIRDTDGRILGERQVGRLFVRGPSVMPGYVHSSTGHSSPVRDGWLDTGDLGYWCGGELVITGRAKDLIIVNGRNVWPQDIEWAVEELPRLRRGDCCAFSVEANDTEKVIVLVESRPQTPDEREALEGEVRQAVKESAGLDALVILVGRQPGLPRTSSGKLARAQARAQFLAGAFE